MKSFVNQLITNYKKKQEVKVPQPTSEEILSLSYHECQQKGDHEGELLSLVCMDPQCNTKDKLLACCICSETVHQGHPTQPLKSLLRQYSSVIQKQQMDFVKIDKDHVFGVLDTHESNMMIKLKSIRQEMLLALDSLDTDVHDLFATFRMQVKSMQNCDEKNVSQLLQEVYKSQSNLEQFQTNLLTLVKNPPEDMSSTKKQQIDQTELIQSIAKFFKDGMSMLEAIKLNTNKQVEEFKLQLRLDAKADLFNNQVAFAFQPHTKHPSLTIIMPTQIKSGSSGYKFGVLTPSLENYKSPKVRFGFKMKEVHTSNWIAVGMCHLKTIENKQFNFGFNNIGHGAYMISSNGGSWSNLKPVANNVVKAFKFAKNDIIYITYDQVSKTITFQKNKTTEMYKLDFEATDEPLHPCALFYYNNDEVEFMQPELCLE